MKGATAGSLPRQIAVFPDCSTGTLPDPSPMLLKIQPDESLTSYVRRNLFLSWYAPGVAVFKELAKRPAFRKEEVQAIASVFGWPGCYGFNRLIHHHTMLAAIYVIKNAQDFSYSENRYASEDFRLCNWDASYPSPASEYDRSYDGYERRRPKQYPCCNFPHPKGKGQKLKATKVGALPGIPKISPENARAKGIVT